MLTRLTFRVFIISLLCTSVPLKAETNNRYTLETKDFRLRLTARPPEQIAAFYEARGFPKPALKKLESMCFFTVGFHNRSKDVIWLDLAEWKFMSNGEEIRRHHRDELRQTWQSIQLPQSLQSTFRWTLMPEQLDFRPNEHEGGNIVIPRSDKKFDLHARFITGKNKQGATLPASIKNIQCAKNP